MHYLKIAGFISFIFIVCALVAANKLWLLVIVANVVVMLGVGIAIVIRLRSTSGTH